MIKQILSNCKSNIINVCIETISFGNIYPFCGFVNSDDDNDYRVFIENIGDIDIEEIIKKMSKSLRLGATPRKLTNK